MAFGGPRVLYWLDLDWSPVTLELVAIGLVLIVATTGWRSAKKPSRRGPNRHIIAFVFLVAVAVGLDLTIGQSGVPVEQPTSAKQSWFSGIKAVVFAPLWEEWVFRFLIYGWLRPSDMARHRVPKVVAAAIVSGIVFGVGHPGNVVATSVSGVATALAYEISGTIWIPIAWHFCRNAGAVGNAYDIDLLRLASAIVATALIVVPILRILGTRAQN